MKAFERIIILNDGTDFKRVLFPVTAENVVEALKIGIKHVKQVNIVDEIKSITITESQI